MSRARRGGAGGQPALLLFLALIETGRSRNISRKHALLELPPTSRRECRGEKHPCAGVLAQLPPQGASLPALALGTEHSPEAQSLPGDLWNSRGAGAVHLFCIYCLSLDSYYTALPSAEGKISLFHVVCFLE